jgi:hypothetical protein
MSDRQKIVAVGCRTVFASIDLFVGAVDAAAQKPDSSDGLGSSVKWTESFWPG